jgi:hypothetical protein
MLLIAKLGILIRGSFVSLTYLLRLLLYLYWKSTSFVGKIYSSGSIISDSINKIWLVVLEINNT